MGHRFWLLTSDKVCYGIALIFWLLAPDFCILVAEFCPDACTLIVEF